MLPRSVASFAQFSYLLSKGGTWEGHIEGSALWIKYLPPFTTLWPTSLPSPKGWILSSMTALLLLYPLLPLSSHKRWRCTDFIAQHPGHASGHTCQEQAHGALEDYTHWQSFLVSLLLHTVQKLSSQSIHFFSLPLPYYNGMLSGPDFSLVLSRPKVTSEWVAPRFRFRVKNRSSS